MLQRCYQGENTPPVPQPWNIPSKPTIAATEPDNVNITLSLVRGFSLRPPAPRDRTNALLRPASGLAVFQSPVPTEPYGRKLALGLMRMYGSRHTTFGLSALAMWYHSQFQVMGWACLAGCIMTITDGLVAKELVGGKEW